jgi:hypothetical protein
MPEICPLEDIRVGQLVGRDRRGNVDDVDLGEVGQVRAPGCRFRLVVMAQR